MQTPLSVVRSSFFLRCQGLIPLPGPETTRTTLHSTLKQFPSHSTFLATTVCVTFWVLVSFLYLGNSPVSFPEFFVPVLQGNGVCVPRCLDSLLNQANKDMNKDPN